MKITLGITRISLLVLVLVLTAGLVGPGATLAKSTEKIPSTAPVHAQARVQEPAIADRVVALKAAKQTGDQELVRSLCEELGWSSAQDPGQVKEEDSDVPHVVVRPELASRDATPGTDVLVNDPQWQSSNPALASTAEGTLYAVLEDVTYDQYYLDIYYSENDGYTWIYKYSLPGSVELSHPSIAIGEGYVNRLLIAYESGAGTASAAIVLFWEDLDTAMSDWVVVEEYPYWVFNPQICVDSPEYINWWPYLTYTKGTLTKQDRYDLVFTRSFDYGDTWQTPSILVTGITPGCQPDIDYGTSGLFITYTKFVASYENDLYVLRSTDLGSSWDPELLLAHSSLDETDPRVAATNGGGTVVVAFTREYSPTNSDIEAFYSQNGGDSWNLVYLPWTSYDEIKVDLTVSRELGRIHAAFWSEHDIHYTWANWDTPNTWAAVEVMNDGGTAATGIRPAVAANPSKPQAGCVAWTDTRVELQYHVFFDATYPLGDYLIIIGNPGLFDAVLPLVNWKQQLGYNVSVVTADMIYEAYTVGDDAERIWDFLHDYHFFFKYLMLVGDIDQIPMRVLYPDGNPAYPPTDPQHHNGLGYGTDYYYAEHTVTNWDLDGDNRWGEFTDDAFDHVPELFIGRLPFNEPDPVLAICSNIVTFEQDTGPWKQYALLAHGFLNQAPEVGVSGSDCASMADYLRTNLMIPLGWTTTTLFERGGIGLSSYWCTDGLSQTSYENNCGFQTYSLINCAAHGNGTGFGAVRWLFDLNASGTCDLAEEWCYNSFSQRDRIPSHPAQSFIYLNGCSTAPILGYDPAFHASSLRSLYLIRTPAGNLALKDYLLSGAAGVIGTSAGSEGSHSWTSPADGNSLSLNYYFYEFLLGLGLPVGDAFHWAHWAYVENHTLQRAMRVFNYFGDPSLVLAGREIGEPGGTRLAERSLPGQLDPEAALRLAASWQDRASPGSTAGDRTMIAGGKSRDEAVTWTECAELPECLTVTSLIQIPGGGVLGAGIAARDTSGTRGVVFASLDGWDPWAMVEMEGMLSARTILRTAEGALLVGGLAGAPPAEFHGIIYRSMDEGQTWYECLPDPGGLITDIYQDMSGKLWAISRLTGRIYSSEDDGASWALEVGFSEFTPLTSIMQASNGRYFITAEAVDDFSIIRSDNGEIWFPVDGLYAVRSAYEIVEVAGHLYAAVAETGGGWLYRSTDLSGEYWERIAEFPVIPGSVAVRSLARDAVGRLFAGVAMGQHHDITHVYTMHPGQVTWHEYGGAVDVADRVTTILPVSGTVYIGTGSFNGNIYRVAGEVTTGTPDDGRTPPYEFNLEQNFPNPFNPSTTITYELPQASAVTLSIYDVSGRLVRILVNSAGEDVGRHQVIWDGRNDAGRPMSAGVYVYRLDAGTLRETRQMVLIK